MDKEKIWDAMVIGAGPGGATTANFLARSGARVLLLDQAEFPRDKTCGDAISPHALAITAELGLLEAVRGAGWRIQGVRLVAPDGGELVAPVPAKEGLSDHFYVARRFAFDELLQHGAVAAGAAFEPQVRVSDLETAGDRIVAVGRSGGKAVRFAARAAVLAVGADISLPRRAGLLSKPPVFGLGARAYYSGLPGLDRRIEFRFDAVPLPGYGWIFPLSEDSANVGAGFLTPSRRLPATPREVLERFVEHPPVRAIMAAGRRQGAVQGFPVRMDFATARTVGERLLAVGETAGLVNPFTGEGIDYAMVSGKIAAEVLTRQLESGDFSAASLGEYDRRLRHRFQKLFVWTLRMRGLYLNRWLLDPLVRAAGRRRAIAQLLMEVVLGYRSADAALSPSTIYRVLRNWRATG